MAGSLDGRKAIITGASSGIGEATARVLAREGAAVAVGARRGEKLEKLAREITSEGGTAHALEVNLADEAAARGFVEKAVEEMGGADILVNNAGVMLLGPVGGADVGDWQKMIDVNLLGLLYCTHAALPLMAEGGGGHIVNVSSTADRVASAGSAVYNMTKFGVQAFSEALRQEALHAKIRVTCLEPGFVDTELQGQNENPYVLEQIEKVRDSMDGKTLKAEDMANAILYAVSQPDHVAVNEILVRPAAQQR